MSNKNGGSALSDPSIDSRKAGAVVGASDDALTQYSVLVSLQGVCPILFHRYDVQEVSEKGKAAKGSARKKEDNIESYVYRCRDGTLGMPAVNFKAALVNRARSVQDPRSPRKSAFDLFKSGILVVPANEKLDPINASFGVKAWAFEDRRRAVIQRAAVTRVRPGLMEDWKLQYVIHCIAPEYISEELLQTVAQDAGRFSGLGDNRPDYGRFRVTEFKRIKI